MSAGVSPVSPVQSVGPASRLQYDATSIAPSGPRAIADPKALPPSVNDPELIRPRPVNDGTQGFSIYA